MDNGLNIFDLLELKYIVKIKMLHDGIYATPESEEDTHEPIYQKLCYELEAVRTDLMINHPDKWEAEKERFLKYEQDHKELLKLYQDRIFLVKGVMELARSRQKS